MTTERNSSRKAYRGVNVIALWAAAHAAGYAPIMPPDPQSQRLRRSPPRTLADARSGDCAGTPGARWEPYRSR